MKLKKTIEGFFLEPTNVLCIRSSNVFCVFPISSQRVLKQSVLRDEDLIKFFFTASSRTLFSETGFSVLFFYWESMVIKNTMITSTVWCHCHLISTKMPTVLPTIVLVSVRQMSKQWEQQEVRITMKKVLTSQTP